MQGGPTTASRNGDRGSRTPAPKAAARAGDRRAGLGGRTGVRREVSNLTPVEASPEPQGTPPPNQGHRRIPLMGWDTYTGPRLGPDATGHPRGVWITPAEGGNGKFGPTPTPQTSISPL